LPIPDRITSRVGMSADPLDETATDGKVSVPTWPVEPGRYRLAAAYACPWANRALIVRNLLGLDDVISLALAGPTHDKRSWTFDLDPGGVDPVLGIERLQQAYFARYPNYPRGITVPAMVDIPTGKVVTNDFPWITHDFFFEWREHHKAGAPNLWRYAKHLYSIPEFGSTINFEQIKTHYYVVISDLNPNGVVPEGPDPAVWTE
jgi:putative glutathione S-transferase